MIIPIWKPGCGLFYAVLVFSLEHLSACGLNGKGHIYIEMVDKGGDSY